MKHDLLYITANADVPTGRVTSTARKGSKWYNTANVGDVFDLKVVETGEIFGQAVLVEKELTTYQSVLDNADHNHVAVKGNTSKHGATSRTELRLALEASYGAESLSPLTTFTILHILPVNAAIEPPVAPGVVFVAMTSEPPLDEEEEERLDNFDTLSSYGERVAAVVEETTVGDVTVLRRVEFFPED